MSSLSWSFTVEALYFDQSSEFCHQPLWEWSFIYWKWSLHIPILWPRIVNTIEILSVWFSEIKVSSISFFLRLYKVPWIKPISGRLNEQSFKEYVISDPLPPLVSYVFLIFKRIPKQTSFSMKIIMRLLYLRQADPNVLFLKNPK